MPLALGPLPRGSSPGLSRTVSRARQSAKPRRCPSFARRRVATGRRAVMTFARKGKSHAIPLLRAVASLPYVRNPEPGTGGYTRGGERYYRAEAINRPYHAVNYLL
jgi:hypothetical protein